MASEDLPAKGKWSDTFKWWADLLKAVVIFACVTGFTLSLLDDRARERDVQQFKSQRKWAALFEQRSSAMTRFSSARSAYLTATDDAFLVAFNGNAFTSTHNKYEKKEEESERLTDYGLAQLSDWQGPRFAEISAALEDLKYWFGSDEDAAVANAISDVGTQVEALGNLFRAERGKNRSRRGIQSSKEWQSFKNDGEYGLARKKYESACDEVLRLGFGVLLDDPDLK